MPGFASPPFDGLAFIGSLVASQNSQIGKPYSIALLLFKAGDKHQTLAFRAVVLFEGLSVASAGFRPVAETEPPLMRFVCLSESV
jgi:hypothetical protein